MSPEAIKAPTIPAEPKDSEMIKLRERRFVLATSLSILAVGAAFAGDKASGVSSNQLELRHSDTPSTFVVGFTTNDTWIKNRDVAIARAKEMAATVPNAPPGSIGLRWFENITPKTHDISHDRDRTCNTAEAAIENNLGLSVSFNLFDQNKQLGGYFPVTAGNIRNFIWTIDDLLETVAGPNATKKPQKPGDPPQCVTSPVNSITLDLINEPNNKTFNRQQYDAKGRFIAPKRYANFISKVPPAIYKEVAKINASRAQDPDFVNQPPLSVDIDAFSLASGSNPIPFLDQTLNELVKRHIKYLYIDELSVHPYPYGSKTTPKEVETYLYPRLVKTLGEYGIYHLPIVYNEEGESTEIPKSRRSLYSPKVRNLPGVSPAKQGGLYRDAINEAACQPDVRGFYIFKNRDDPRDHWHSGLLYPNGSAKASRYIVGQTFEQAIDGSLPDCQQ